jgi:hypothetical protein
MAEGLTHEEVDTDTDSRGRGAAVMSATQDAAEMVRTTAEKAAAKLPDAVAGAQVAATETQRRLDEMPNQALLAGTSFSLGLGIGLFLTGANRLLVALALAPAAAMLMTMFGREQETPTTGSSRRTSRASNGTD